MKKAPFWTLKNRKKEDCVLPTNSQKQLESTFSHIRTAFPETTSCVLLNREGELLYVVLLTFHLSQQVNSLPVQRACG